MCGKNSTTTSTNTPNPQALQTYSTLLNQMGAVAGTPFQPYGGEFVAPVNQQEQLAGSNINANAGFAQPYISQAAQYANNAAQPIGAQQIANYQNPYTQQVVNATEAQMNQQNAIQQSQLTGNAAAQGALGNNRVGLAQAALAGQQQLAEAPTIAGLYSQGYGQALQEANTEQQAQAQAAYSLGNLGVAGQNAALTGAGAELGYGQLGQQTQQAQDTALYNQFLAQQGYPFQVTGWEAGLASGLGSQMGGTNVTQGPAPNPLSSILGLGFLGLGGYNAYTSGGHKDGGRVANCGRRIAGFAMGGVPYSSLDEDAAASYIPTVQIQPGNTMPKGPSGSGQQQQTNPIQQANSLLGLQKAGQNFGGTLGQAWNSFQTNTDPIDASGDLIDAGGPIAGKRGGRIAGFAGGGSPDMDYAEGGGPGEQPYQLASLTGSPDMPVISPEMLPSASPAAGLAGPAPPAQSSAAPPVSPVSIAGGTAQPADLSFSGNLTGNGETTAGFAQGANPQQVAPVSVASRSGALGPGSQIVPIDQAAHAIGKFESGNNYQEVGQPTHGGVALGRYQIMSQYLPSYLKQAGLPPMTAHDFLSNPEAQDQVFNKVFGGLMDKYGNFNDAASIWFSGRPVAQAGNAKDALGTTVPMYLANTNAILAHGMGDGSPTQTAGLGSSRMAFAPTSGQASAAPEGTDQKPGFLDKLFHNPQLGQSLMAAGLGMMASRSPYLGNAIGEGGLAAFNEDLALKKLQKDADAMHQRIAHETKLEQQAQERIELSKKAYEQSKVPTGMQRGAQGNLELIPGYAESQGALERAKKGGTSASLPDEAWAHNGDDFLSYLPAGDREFIKKVAGYEIDPKTLSTMGGRREDTLKMASQYDPNFDQKTYNIRANAVTRFATGKQGDTVRSLNVAADHLDTLGQLADALGNGDVRALNQINNWVKTELGKPAVTNFNTGKQIIADEVLKSVIGSGAGSVTDREELQKQFAAANSPAQLKGAIETAQRLMVGQMKGLRTQFTDSTGLDEQHFERKLSPATRDILHKFEGPGGAPGSASAPAGGGRTLTAQDQQALQWANANPQDPRAAQIKQRLGVQ